MDNNIEVHWTGPEAHAGILNFNGKEYRCALGQNGIAAPGKKVEGDSKTPSGTFALRRVYYRADRVQKPQSAFETVELRQDMGWCDDVRNLSYNTEVALPYAASHENLWREDRVYDIIVPLGYNDDPAVPGKGSAIFMHIARENYVPTEGCVALKAEDLTEVLRECGPDSKIVIA